MRVDSIIAISANQQNSPRSKQYDNSPNDKNASGVSFEEFLKAKLQQTSSPTVTRQAENQVAGLLMGYFSSLKIAKTEPKPKENAG